MRPIDTGPKTRRKLGRAASAILLGAALLSALAPSVTGAAGTGFKALRVGSPLSDLTFGPQTAIDDVSMLNASLGYAVVGSASRGSPFALARSTNGAKSWRYEGELPITNRFGAAWETPSIDFVNVNVGYVSALDGPLWVTSNAGATWSRVATPGVWPTYSVEGSTLWVVSDVCSFAPPAYGPLKCPSQLSEYRLGATTAERSVAIPARGPASSWRAARVLASASPASVVVVEGGGEATRSSLLVSIDGGAHWTLASDPCEGLIPRQLLTPTPHQVLLYCFLDGGMNQGTSQLWQSNWDLRAWTPRSRASEMSSPRNSIGDVPLTLSVSRDHSVLFAQEGGASNGVRYSTNDGARWSSAQIPLIDAGGAPSYLSTFGARGALFGVDGGPSFQTTNARTWHQLAALRAGLYHGERICTPDAGVRVHLHATMTGIPATTLDYPVIFTNTSSHACYLNGVPTSQPVEGAARAPLGPVAWPSNASGPGGYVILRAHGGRASVVFESDLTNHYSATFCAAKIMTGLEISFAPPSRFYVKMPRRAVCTGISTVRNGAVKPGVVTWL